MPTLDPILATERLLWLEAQALDLAAEATRVAARARRARRRSAHAFVDPREIEEELAALRLELDSRRDEAELWEGTLRGGR